MNRLKQILQNGILCMLASSLFFAMMGALVKYSLEEIPLFEVVFFRSVLSASLLGYFIWRRKGSFFGNRPLLLLGRGLAGFFAIITNFYAVANIPLGDAAILNQTSPLFVAFFSVLFLGEKLPAKIFLLSLFSLAGVALVVKPSFSYLNLAALSGLVSGVMAAFAYVAIRELHATDSFLTMAFYFTGVTSILSAPFALREFVAPRIPVLLALIGVGITGTMGQMLMTYAYKNEKASLVSPFSYTAVIISFLFGVVFFSEIPDRYSVLGSLAVIASCVALLRIRKMEYLEIEE
ncbi:MAG: DMT family transporter [bacterium]